MWGMRFPIKCSDIIVTHYVANRKKTCIVKWGKEQPNITSLALTPHPAVIESMFSWLIMVTHGYFMVMFLYSMLMVKIVTTVQQKHG